METDGERESMEYELLACLDDEDDENSAANIVSPLHRWAFK